MCSDLGCVVLCLCCSANYQKCIVNWDVLCCSVNYQKCIVVISNCCVVCVCVCVCVVVLITKNA